ncbi:hypothetical protein AQUCO_00700437v1 [Aquilegia coerulea]|uniref:F-box domain-containing protein n=1 Tax=Aquilegia coerulea TaxID=218851 RepID=A0A2G5EJZ4_AQUCA|nr:hypothetical protein AQUCO_00700437v1 [Aquilegia coerulea]
MTGKRSLPHLPDEVLLNIFSRLPADCLLQCRDIYRPLGNMIANPSFVDVHFKRATPVIAFCYEGAEKKMSNKGDVRFTDEVAKQIKTKRSTLSSKYVLYCSCNGFLLFRYKHLLHDIQIWNPITQQKVEVHSLGSHYSACGFFVHPPTMEYSVLLVHGAANNFQYSVYGLMSETVRPIKNFTHSPTKGKAPIFLDGILHWMVDVSDYKRLHEET